MGRWPEKPAPEIEKLRSRFEEQWVTETREYEVITFLMGGGVEPHQVDPVTTVRAAEIKGLLRYWWRAIRGGMFDGNLKRMREREAEIWGWSGDQQKGTGQSSVHLEVETLANGTEVSSVETRKGDVPIAHWSSPYSYVAFPLQSRHHKVLEGVRFRLHIRYPSGLKPEVEAALWAWETFGGIGARTRRGFGALRRVDKDASHPETGNVEAWIRENLRQRLGGSLWPEGVPHVDPQMPLAIASSSKDAFEVWKHLIQCLRSFRQARHPGKRGNRPGRSQWPEPDAIRRLWQQQRPPRKPPVHSPDHPVFKFPRGQMGLPIVFHFKLEKEKRENFVEPPDTILQGAQHTRWASRLILKPLACRDGYVGLVAVLAGPDRPPGGWRLTGGVDQPVDATLTPDEARQIEPLHRLGDMTDVLEAFVKFVSERKCNWKPRR